MHTWQGNKHEVTVDKLVRGFPPRRFGWLDRVAAYFGLVPLYAPAR